ncbi:MAG: helix-turn-helix domain-containing protein [Sphingopyxis sp.]|nr:helix-turn-helix domain-containing protein [Sphingopyxis sp.]
MDFRLLELELVRYFAFMAWNKPTDDLPNRIRFWRQKRKLTLETLGERNGMTRANLSRFETGGRTLSIEWLRRIATALDLSVADLLAPKDNPWQLNDDERALIAAVRGEGVVNLDAVRCVAETIRARSTQPS